MEESVPLLVNEGIPAVDNQNHQDYEGYEPVYPADFPFEEDDRHRSNDDDDDGSVDPNLLRDNATTSKSLLVFSIFFCLAFISLLVWQILVAKCRVANLCDITDHSSKSSSDYLFQNFPFRTPAALIWLGLTCGTFGLLVSSIFAVFVLRKAVGTSKMVEIATVVRKGSTSFLAHQNLAILGPLLLLSVLIGVGINWSTAGTFALGAVISMTTTEAGISIATRGNVRASAAAHNGLKEAMKVAFRSGSIAGLSILSIALIGISAAYLMFADVRSLAGFAAGASLTSSFLRVSGGIFTRATSKTAALLHSPERTDRNPSSRTKKKVATYIGSGVGTIFGLGPGLFESFVAAVVATAILGSNLPFFYRDSYALCVNNHLAIDQYCGPFGYPEQLSYAIYVCRNRNFYISYPQLTTWTSNTAFVAVPFVIGAAGLLVCLVCMLHVRVSSQSIDSKVDKRNAVQSLRFNMRLNMLLGSVLLIVSSAGIIFGLFGPKSSFQQMPGFGEKENLLRMELDRDVNNTCLSTSLNITETSAFNPFPIPQGGRHIMGKYRPVNDIGKQIGPANTTDERLFGCAVLGILLGVLMTGFCSVFFTAEIFAPTQRVAKAAQFGVTSTILQGLGNGLIGSLAPTIFLLLGVLSSHALYGAYGVGVMTVTFLSAAGIVATGNVLGSIADNARGIARMAKFTKRARRRVTVLDAVGAAVSVSGTEFANGGAFLAAISLLFATIQISGMFPSPTEIVGTPEQPPLRLIWRTEGIPLWNIHVLIGVMIGAVQPIIVAGLLLLAVRRSARAMISVTKREANRDSGRYARFVGAITQICLVEAIIPVVIMFMTPLIVGFGLGQRALLAMLIATIGTGLALGTSITSAAGSWEGAERIIAGRGGTLGRGSEKHWTTLYAREFGSPLQECVTPGLQCIMKTGVSASLVAIALMQADNNKGWIGGILLAVLILLVSMIVTWRSTWTSRFAGNGKSVNRSKVNAPPKRISPFFVEAVTVDPRAVAPGSQMAEALDTVGSPNVPMLAGLLPGLSDRSQVDLGNVELLQSPNATLAGEGYVLKDDTRPA